LSWWSGSCGIRHCL